MQEYIKRPCLLTDSVIILLFTDISKGGKRIGKLWRRSPNTYQCHAVLISPNWNKGKLLPITMLGRVHLKLAASLVEIT